MTSSTPAPTDAGALAKIADKYERDASLYRIGSPTYAKECDLIAAALRNSAPQETRGDERAETIEECAHHLYECYPEHAAINAYCAAIRSLLDNEKTTRAMALARARAASQQSLDTEPKL